MVGRDFYCVRLPTIDGSEKYMGIENRAVATRAFSKRDASTNVISRVGWNTGKIVRLLEEKYAGKDIGEYAVNVSRLDQEIGVSKIEGSLMDFSGNVLEEATGKELMVGLRGKLGGRLEDYRIVADEYISS